MKIAFASCMCTSVYPEQPVWSQIAAQQPDHLVLLGDSIYLDIGEPQPPQALDDLAFAERLLRLYRAQLAEPHFLALVRGMPADGRVHSLWDDHDFLWDDANGAQVRAQKVHRGKIALSTAFQQAWRRTLAQRAAPGSFPTEINDPAWWPADPQPLEVPSLALAPDCWLHLSDGRTWRTGTSALGGARRSLLGPAQRQQLGAAIRARPQAVHLFASGSTFSAYKRYETDWQWLLDLAAQQRTLVLSGDIHRNDLDAFYTGGLPLHEATSSGAAVKFAVVAGSPRQNFGLLELDDDAVTVRLFAKGREERRRTLDRASWLPR